MAIKTIIIGSGYYLPEKVVRNEDFLENTFLQENGESFPHSNEEIIQKFVDITGIKERRYVQDNNISASDLGAWSAKKAIEDAGIDKETIDFIIAAHNFGDVDYKTLQSDMMPSISAKIKAKLDIKNESCIPYDMLFGCPGWIEGLILGDRLIRLGEAKRVLVVGTETISKKINPYDRDSMIFADGAGAVILEGVETDKNIGIIGYKTISHQGDELDYLTNGKAKNNPDGDSLFIQMKGRKIYEYALIRVPKAMKTLLDEHGYDIEDVDKILIHQANEKMDEAIVERLGKLYKKPLNIEELMPMTIGEYGNSSVATVPTLYDKIIKNEMPNHELKSGDLVLMASVGAGMNINSLLYRIP